ncbi:hypothetical protein M9Y10_004027 [Tritrichomonas musculus]|uniref:DUF3447 domain-containing protein n=1 Tax=Tritrichomonas musculus TaxID=1915356 RepID=A0ABR2JRD0_9EUKA
MQSMQFFREFTGKMKEAQSKLLEFLENTKVQEVDFQRLIQYLNNSKIPENKQEFKCLLHLISKISNNHHRSNGFIQKIEQILKHFAQDIQKYFTSFDIFNIFKGNKVILLFIFTEKIATPDMRIINYLTKEKYLNRNYFKYFYNEFKSLYTKDFYNQYNLKDFELPPNSENQKEIGESNTEFLEFLKTDDLIKFKEYVTNYNYSINKPIKFSIFESNPFLLKFNAISLIEYVSFYGGIEILKYLVSKNCKLTQSLWLFGIHSNNIEIIQYLEENSIKPPSGNYNKCLIEAIKCHHINIMNYIKEKYIQNDQKISVFSIAKDLRYYNFFSLSEKVDKIESFNDVEQQFYTCQDKITNIFYEFCKFDYVPIVEFLLMNEKFDLNEPRILF